MAIDRVNVYTSGMDDAAFMADQKTDLPSFRARVSDLLKGLGEG